MENLEETEQIQQEETLPPQPSPKKKYLLIGGIITLVVLIGGAGILMLLPQKETKIPTPVETLPTPKVQEPDVITSVEEIVTSFRGTLTDVFATKEPISCTYADILLIYERQGTLYFIDESNYAIDATILNPPYEPTEPHVIRDGEYEYVWGIPESFELKAVGGTKQRIGPFYKEHEELLKFFGEYTEFQCQSWTFNNYRFIPPSNIEFEVIPPNLG